MKLLISRIIAVLFLVVPGIAAAYGFMMVKDSLFDYIGRSSSSVSFGWSSFVPGLLLFFLGAGFIGGWVFYRDRKRNYVAPRFKAKRKPVRHNQE
ncbi:DUF2627 domain-containing protein [Gorillibacterium massiliense]|uniref:DUF2627 domain-containing protein n=1 Tax=Gorillibacterium massiliense TaxID=1280390 RepID=UPI0004BC50F7|nr:DUF2627 domain-containing protein [Gorillibacterium massiliense]